MAKKRTATKNKNKSKLHSKAVFYRASAKKCFLYRWARTDSCVTSYRVNGPYAESKNVHYIQWAKANVNSWKCVIISTFMDKNGNYTEESIELPVIHQIKLDQFLPKNSAMVSDAIKCTLDTHTFSEYIDTVICWRLASKSLDYKLNNFEWVKEQTQLRYSQLLKYQIDNLTSVLNSK